MVDAKKDVLTMMQDKKFEVLAVESSDDGVTYLGHTWENQTAHIVRKDGKFRRCVIGKLVMTNTSEVAIFVRFRETQPQTDTVCTMQKSISPLHLLIANELWLRCDAMSEVETESDGLDARDYDELYPRQSALPWFELGDTARLTKIEKRKLQWMIAQVHGIQKLLQGLTLDDE